LLTVALAVKSELPKLSPDTVTDDNPVETLLRLICDTTGPSKVYVPIPVPAMAPTVTTSIERPARSGVALHITLELELHAAVWHSPVPTAAEDVYWEVPKLRPTTVTDVSPVSTELICPTDATGASYENVLMPVPTIALTVVYTAVVSANNAAELQATDVPESQEAQLHCAASKTMLCVKSRDPKFSPTTVTEAAPA
jgi:hypothetical protein